MQFSQSYYNIHQPDSASILAEEIKMEKTTFSVILGTRDFFPAEPVLASRREILHLLREMGYEVVILDETGTPLGAVETWEQAKNVLPCSKPTLTGSTASW
jgi:hypothetical protein